MPILKKKSQSSDGADMVTEASQPVKSGRIGRKINLPPESETDMPENEAVPPAAVEPRIRMCTDIDEQAYINLKCYATMQRKSVVSILNNLIYTYCPVKISLQ